MDKCAYCHEEVLSPHCVEAEKGKEHLVCCSEACGQKALSFYKFFERTKIFFFIGLTLSMVILLASVILLGMEHLLSGSIFMGSSIALLGLLILVFPFATPETFKGLGIRKTMLVTRLLGIGVIILGPILTLLLRG